MTGEMIGGVVRHLLTTFGGVLIAKGYIDAEQLAAIAGGAAALIGVVWSMLAKQRALN